jgi:Putative peptidoglycan binding domain
MSPLPTTTRYGGFVLDRGSTHKPEVKLMQQDLYDCGFTFVGTPADGAFGRHTAWAVREFQIYSKMAQIAEESGTGGTYLSRLTQIANPDPYTGPVSGVLNQDTADRLDYWRSNNLRCPVVIQAMNISHGAPTTPTHENLWLHNDVTSTAPRMYARDFTDYYTLPSGRNAADLRVVGDYTSSLLGGPESIPPRHTWAEAEITPESLIGTAWGSLTPAQQSTFKVVRAISEEECIGFADVLNAYDNAFVSQGICHWTLGLNDAGTISKGELCGFFALFRDLFPVEYDFALGTFGVRMDDDWTTAATGAHDGSALWTSTLRKYTSWPALQDESGGYTTLPRADADGAYFKMWHWIYRLEMAARTCTAYTNAMWSMARVRVRDVLACPWGAAAPAVAAVSGNPATIGDVFTSEKAVAMIVRWHVFRPSHMVNTTAGAHVRGALTRAQTAKPSLGWSSDPSTWTDAHEAALLDGLRDEAAATPKLKDTIDRVDGWPAWLGGSNPRGFAVALPAGTALGETRGSFSFDSSALPAAPP